MKANKSVETNRRPASPLDAGREFGAASHAPPSLSATVAHLCRYAPGSKTHDANHHQKDTGRRNCRHGGGHACFLGPDFQGIWPHETE